ncbi:MAG: glycosyltransferase family 39 protein [Roseburia sp.]|nr:glycosyltransferase family 39 protein [Roseburia sp.]MCM1278262.1 glycosyltransferase family 39 protein [Robinsoniella sp.]
MILLLPIAFLLFFIFVKTKEETGFFETGARALLLWQLAVLVITNLLSIFSLLGRVSLSLCWLLLSAALVLFIYRYAKAANKDVIPDSDCTFSMYVRQRLSVLWKDFSPSEKLMASLLLFLFLLLFFAALFTVPYNFDSMTYHLARIGHWIDNQSVNHFITNIDRQNYSPVLAEYNLLHMYLLTNSDSFLNLLQYAAMLMTSLTIYKCARLLGTDRSFSVFGAFLFVTMPLTISQSMTTQNDLFGAMWFALFLYYLLQFIQMEKIVPDKNTLKLLFFTALTVAFAFLTKTSICASMVFFLPWLLIMRLQKKDKLLSLIQSACFAGLTIAVTISETIIRNLLSAGTIMPDTASGNIMVATKNVSYIIVNILKNYSLILTQHLSDALNGFICRIAIHTGAALQVEVNNEAISFHGFDYIRHMNRGANMYSHDITPSALVGYLAFFCGLLLFVLLLTSRKSASVSIGFGISCWLSFGFIMALLRWQPWGTRLMYPALAMTVIMIANLLGCLFQKLPKKGILLIPLTALSLFLAIPSITYNTKPAFENVKEGCSNRFSHYFTYNKRFDSYQELSQRLLSINQQPLAPEIPLSNRDSVGLLISGDGYDYPLWLIFRQKLPGIRLQHILLEDTANGSSDSKLPAYILQIERGALAVGDSLTYKGQEYICIFVSSNGEDGIFQTTKNQETALFLQGQ